MRIGIVGLAQSGKSTVFAAACGFSTSDGKISSRANIKVPDPRLDILAKLESSRKIINAEIEILDSDMRSDLNRSAGAAAGVTGDLQLVDALILTLDNFTGARDPRVDFKTVIDEMILYDLTQIDSAIPRLEKIVLSGSAKERKGELEMLKKLHETLEEEKPLLELDLSPAEESEVRGYTLVSRKPLLIVVNIAEDNLNSVSELTESWQDVVSPGRREVAVLCGKIEMELAQMEPEDRELFMEDLGIKNSAVDLVIQKSYQLLGLISFFTAEEKETRAWTIRKGQSVQKAAGVIHTDLERGFIRAEVIGYDNYVACKTVAEARRTGKLGIEGKEYVVQDGDVLRIRFNV